MTGRILFYSGVAALAIATLVACPIELGVYNVTGRVTTESGSGLGDVLLTVDREYLIALTDASGHWSVREMDGWHNVVPIKDGYVFEPPSIRIGPTTPMLTGIDFTAVHRPYYPNTAESPVLQFQWSSESPHGPLNLTPGVDGHILTCVPFGYERDNASRNPEFAIFLRNRRRDPVYALAPGTVIYKRDWENFETAIEPGKGGEVWVRFGRNYTVGYRHVVTDGTDIEVGDMIDRGERIGFTADHGEDGSYYSIMLGRRRDGNYHFVNPLRLFDPYSWMYLLTLWNSSSDTDFPPYASVAEPWGDILEIPVQGSEHALIEKGGL